MRLRIETKDELNETKDETAPLLSLLDGRMFGIVFFSSFWWEDVWNCIFC